MFHYISGRLALLEHGVAVIDAGGVGYKLTISDTTYDAMPHNRSTKEPPVVRLYTYMAVREDGIELFGFMNETELASFKMLISVSGVGPKAAMSILSLLTPEKFALAVCTDDKKTIAKANGIGPKTAARIILELRRRGSDIHGRGLVGAVVCGRTLQTLRGHRCTRGVGILACRGRGGPQGYRPLVLRAGGDHPSLAQKADEILIRKGVRHSHGF